MFYTRYIISFFLLLLVPFTLPPLSFGKGDVSKETVKEDVKELGEASKVIQKFNDTLLEAMKKGKDMGYKNRYELLTPVVRNTFSFPYMARKSTGKYWKDFDKNQKWLVVEKYTEWTTATYAGRFNEYDGEKFEIVSEEEDRNTVSVKSNIIESDGDKVEFVYRLRDFSGKWQVIDILLQGDVSQLAMTRSQFIGILNKGGYDGLLANFQEKIEEFAKKEE